MKKIIGLVIVLLFVASVALAGEKETAAQQATGLNGMRDVFKSVPNLDECVRPQPIQILMTEYQGITFYRLSSNAPFSSTETIFTMLETAEFWARMENEVNMYVYKSCQELRKNLLREEVRENKDVKWIEVK